MGRVFSHMTMSLDGFIANPDDGVTELFGWYEAGPVTVPSADESWSFQVDERSAEVLRDMLAGTGALVCGQRLFEHTHGWGDRHPVGAPVVVVTHQPPEDAGTWENHQLRRQRAGGYRRGEGDRRGQGRHHRECQHRPAGAGPGPGRRGHDQPGAGAAGEGHPVLRLASRRRTGSTTRSSSRAAGPPT